MYVELSITSNFTFLTGASHPEEYIERAATLNLPAIAIADDNSVAGIVRAHTQARAIARKLQERRDWDATNSPIGPIHPDQTSTLSLGTAPRLIPAARLVFSDAPPITVLPINRTGWGNLCRILSTGRLRTKKGQCDLQLADLMDRPDGLHLLLWPQAEASKRGAGEWGPVVERLTRRFGKRMHLLLTPLYDGRDRVRFDALATQAAGLGIPTLASAAPHMHHGNRRKLADVLSAIRLHRKVDDLGRDALANGEARLRSEAEMRRLFAGHEGAVERAGVLGRDLTFSLDELRYEYPKEAKGTETPAQRLERLALEGLDWRYPAGASERVRKMLAHELALIGKLK